MTTPKKPAENSILFFFFPRAHRLPVGSLYGGMMSAASQLGVEAILLRFGSIGSIASILAPPKLRTVTKSGAAVGPQPEASKPEERPIVAERLDWRLLRWIIHVVTSPFQLFTTVYSRRPRRIIVRDLPHAVIAAPIAKVFGVPLLFVADSRSWTELDPPDPLTGKPSKREPSLVRTWWHAISAGAVRLVSTLIIVPSYRIRAIFAPGSSPVPAGDLPAGRVKDRVIVSSFPLLVLDDQLPSDEGRTALLRQHSFPEDSFLIVADISDYDLRTIELFLRAIHAMDLLNISMLLLGEVDDRERIRSLIIGFGLRESVHLTGWVDAPSTVYGFADLVVCLPSAAGIGTATLGAMRLGIPVALPDDLDGQMMFGRRDLMYRDLHVEHFSSWLRELIMNSDRIDDLQKFTAERGQELAGLEREKMLNALLEVRP